MTEWDMNIEIVKEIASQLAKALEESEDTEQKDQLMMQLIALEWMITKIEVVNLVRNVIKTEF